MQRTSSGTWVKGVAEMFASQGVDVPSLFRCAGLELARLQRPDERFTADEVSRLWMLAVESSGNPTLGLDRALTCRHVNFDVVGYAMLASPTLRHGLDKLARYLSIVSDAATFALQPDHGDAWLVLGGTGYTLPVPRQRYAYGLLSLATLCEWLTRRSIVPLAVEFKFEAPPEARAFEQAFGCRVRFGQPENRMLLATSDLDAPVPSRNPDMLVVHERILEQRLSHLGQSRISYRVTEEILRRLPAGEPRREEVAASLALADRTLQRRLHEEHTSFQQLLDDARRELASKYLAEERYPLQEVAHLLGFGDASNFFRACRRWFGVPPGQYRDAMHLRQPEPN